MMSLKNISYFFLLLFSTSKNKECIKIAEKSKKIPFIILFISLIILVLPIVIIVYQQNGSDWIKKNKYVYDIDIGLTKLSEYNKKNKNIKLLIKKDLNNNNFIDIDQSEWDKSFEKNGSFHSFIWERKEKKYLEVFFIDTPDLKVFSNFVNEILKNNINKNSSSFIIFGKYNICCYLFKPKEKKYLSYLFGNYNKIPINTDLLNDFYVENNNSKTLKKWICFFDDVFIGNRNNFVITTTLNFLIIYFFYIILLSLMIWIFNKNKNKFSIFKYQKIIYCAIFVPSIITFLINLLFFTYNINTFLILISMRMMWFNSDTFNQDNDKTVIEDRTLSS